MARRDEGFAMMTVVMGLGAIVVLATVVFQGALREYDGAQYQRRDDTLIAGAEAMLERYATKLTIDPLYYLSWVDEAELPRRCTQNGSSGNGDVVQPGNAWFDDCFTWTYEPLADYYYHPLILGVVDNPSDDVGVRMTVTPPESSEIGVGVTLVATHGEFGQSRAVQASVRAEAISEFAFLVEDDLRFGSGANIHGKVYTGGNLDFVQTPDQGRVHRNAYAEGLIGRTPGYGPPEFVSGSVGYDSGGTYQDIRTQYPDPLDFTNFWDDLEIIRNVACYRDGLCLSATNPALNLTQTPTAWLLRPTTNGSNARIEVSVAYSSTTTGCLTAEEWWWLNSQNAAWTLLGTYDVPPSGVVWVEGHAVIGQPGDTSRIGRSMTIYAGSLGASRNVILASDIIYQSGTSGTTVLGLIASDEIWINPYAVGGDNEMTFSAALLGQGGSLNVARDCGSSGSVILPYSGGSPVSTLHTNGAMALRDTGDVAAHFGTRNYQFDSRLETMRPPFFPLMRETWTYQEWFEVNLPCWATAAGCGS